MTASTPLIPVAETRSIPQSARVVAFIIAAISLVVFSVSNTAAQRKAATAAPAAEDESGIFKEYRGIQLGMAADEVRKKLGSPKDKSDDQDFFIFDEKETAQIVYDPGHKVVTISVDFLSAGTEVPTYKQVVGGEPEAKADGSVYKMVRFTKAGYWLSYNRTGGTAPLTTVTLQKIQ
jgi:hypothetical protein